MAITDDIVNNPERSSPYKLQIFAQAVVLQRRKSPKTEMQRTEFGVDIPVQNWYDEFECKQVASNFNALYIKRSDFHKYWEELGKAVMKTMDDKGLFKA